MYIYVCISHTNLLSSGLSQLIVRTTSIPFPALIRVLRLISTLIRHYDSLLSAECEIFLNNIFQFIDSDKHLWQRTAALEVRLRACKRTLSIDWNYSLFCRADFCCTHMLSLSLSLALSPIRTVNCKAFNEICVNPELLLKVFQRYDCQPGGTKIFNKIVRHEYFYDCGSKRILGERFRTVYWTSMRYCRFLEGYCNT